MVIMVDKNFPNIDYVVSNLPFIKSREIKKLNSEITAINEWIKATNKFRQRVKLKKRYFCLYSFLLTPYSFRKWENWFDFIKCLVGT